ncbi:ABC transporter substrate-binding protein [uncultured Roseibium sp.]|uniref:substrate-binding periplasmic protein n=1 Tax=uncultured Roseibium sp. TaxID=1936171 RepID=UPI0026161885|nr:ABC transporter substrate-binding protein [uncultured Roseibium sp.]
MRDLTRRSVVAGLAAFSALPSARTSFARSELNALKVMTEEYPPFNYQDGSGLNGISVEIMAEIFRRTNSGHGRGDIELLPWARGYNLTLQRPGHALFSTTRTQDREELFKWVGPFVPTVVGLTAKKSRELDIKTVHDLANIRIGVVKDDVGQLLLRAQGVPDDRIEAVLSNEQNFRKLMAGRVDAISYETKVTRWGLQQFGANLDDYETVYELDRGQLYLALHHQTSDDVVESLQSAFNSLVKDGTHNMILKSYGITS